MSLASLDVGDLLLEVFAFPQSQLTHQAQELGFSASRFTKEDGDLGSPKGQEILWQRIRDKQPYHIFVAPDCSPWGSWSYLNIARSPLTALRIQEERIRQRKILALCSRICEYQVQRGRHFSMEHPRGSLAWRQSELKPVIRCTHAAEFEMCAFDFRMSPRSPRIQKRTTIRSTSLEILRSLKEKRCNGDHPHMKIEGSVRCAGQRVPVSKWTASYGRRFATHLAKCMGSGPHRKVYEILRGDAYPASEEKVYDPPLTRKRFKTPSGFKGLTSGEVRHKKRGPSDIPETRPAQVPRMQSGNTGPPSVCNPNVDKCPVVSDFNRASWMQVFANVTQHSPTRGTSRIPESSLCFRSLTSLIHPNTLKAAYVTRNACRPQNPMTAPAAAEASFRVSVAQERSQGEIRQLPTLERSGSHQTRNQDSIPSASLLITLYVQRSESHPRAPESSEPAALPPPTEPVAAARAGAGDAVSAPPLAAAPAGAPNPNSNQPDLEGWAPPPTPLHGPKFRALSAAEKQELIRIHRNLGHPEPLKLAEQLQLSKYPESMVEGARDYVCDTCVETSKVKHQRPAKLKEPTEFNDVVGLDGFFWKGRGGFQVYVVHCIDEASLFHLGRRSSTRHLSEAIRILNETWTAWAGFPRHMYLDPAGEFRSDQLLSYLQQHNTSHFMTAEAWQRGRVERHGDILKTMLERFDTDKAIESIEEFDQVLLECFRAKNSLVRHQGYSPEQVVLGKATVLPGSVSADENAGAHSLAESDGVEAENFRRHLERRCLARQAFLSADNDSALRRSALRRSCPTRGPYLPNQYVLYWLKKSSPNRLGAGRWHGPARVIATEGQSVVWVSHGTRILRCPPEYLRPASLREWQSLSQSSQPANPGAVGGAHSMFDLASQSPPTVEEQGSRSHLLTGLQSSATTLPDTIAPPEVPDLSSNADVPELPHMSPQLSSGGISQPEQELPPQTSDIVPPEPSSVEHPSASTPEPDYLDVPVPSSDEDLAAEPDATPDPIMLSCHCLEDSSRPDPLLEILDYVPAVQHPASPELCPIMIAEDNLPWVAEPLEPEEGMAFCLEIPIKEKDVKKWLQESCPEQMVAVANAGRKARAEVSLRELSPEERKMFAEAKSKELSCWLQTNAIRRILRRKLNPDQILKSRWVLTWKPPEPGSTVKRAKARLVVLGYQDPRLTELARDSPTLTREGRSVVLQTIASRRWRLQSFDIKTAFLRGKADGDNPLAMEPPRELRELLKLQDNEVCELIGNAYGRVDAPLLFYKELSGQLKKLGFKPHPLDPCIFILESGEGPGRILHGVLGMHVDDGVGGGDAYFSKQIQLLKKVLPFGSEKQDSFVFTGIQLDQQPDFTIKASQKGYVNQIMPIEVPKARRQTPEAPLNSQEISLLRGLIGSLQYAVTHTRPDLAARLSEIQTQVAHPTIRTILDGNKVFREAQAFEEVAITYLALDPAQVTFVSFGDASFASSRNLNSHQGTLIGVTTPKLEDNVEAPMSPLVWVSKKIARVVRSTLSAEAYAMSKSVDLLGWIRALWGCIHVPAFPWQDPSRACQLLNRALVVTDCKSLFDLVTRTAIPNCQEYRTTLEVLLIRQRCAEHTKFRWVPTTVMLADGLTKSMSVELLREIMRICRFKLHDEEHALPKEVHRKAVLSWLQKMA